MDFKMYIHKMEYYSSSKKKEILPFVTAWMNPKDNTLSETSDGKRQILYGITYMWTWWPRDRTCISCISCIGRQILYHQSLLGCLYVDTFFFYKVKLTESGNRMWLPAAEEAKEMERSWSKGTKLQLQLIKFWGCCHSMVITGNNSYCILKFAKTVDHGTLFTIFAYVKSSCCTL